MAVIPVGWPTPRHLAHHPRRSTIPRYGNHERERKKERERERQRQREIDRKREAKGIGRRLHVCVFVSLWKQLV